MKSYKVFKAYNAWSTDGLASKAEDLINEKVREGYELVDVSFSGSRMVCFITMCK